MIRARSSQAMPFATQTTAPASAGSGPLDTAQLEVLRLLDLLRVDIPVSGSEQAVNGMHLSLVYSKLAFGRLRWANSRHRPIRSPLQQWYRKYKVSMCCVNITVQMGSSGQDGSLMFKADEKDFVKMDVRDAAWPCGHQCLTTTRFVCLPARLRSEQGTGRRHDSSGSSSTISACCTGAGAGGSLGGERIGIGPLDG